MKIWDVELVQENGLEWLAEGRERRVGPIGKDREERHRRMMLAH